MRLTPEALTKLPHPYEDHPARPGDCSVCAAGQADPIHEVKSPFDPNPRKLEPAQNGYRWCDGCESVQPVTGHECLARDYWRDDGNPLPSDFEGRAELAESLLCAMALDHAADLATGGQCSEMLSWSEDDVCVFCDAERKHEVRK